MSKRQKEPIDVRQLISANAQFWKNEDPQALATGRVEFKGITRHYHLCIVG